MSGDEILTMIEEFFLSCNGDGEFVPADRLNSYHVIGSAPSSGRVVFGTKWLSVYRILNESEIPDDLSFICQCALPHRLDVPWLREFVGDRQILFLGDLDPPALLSFAWLRAALYPTPVVHFGVNDALLDNLKIELPPSHMIHLTANETSGLAVVDRVLPDLNKVIGTRGAKVLASHRKIEQEAVISYLGTGAPFLQLLQLI